MGLTDRELQGVQRAACEDCNLQLSWLSGPCPHAEECHAQLSVLLGIGAKVVDLLEAIAPPEELG